MNLKIKKTISTLLLGIVLVISVPLAALAQAPQAPSASEAPSATSAPQAPEAPPSPPSPTESPSPSPEPSGEAQASASQDQNSGSTQSGESDEESDEEYIGGTSATNSGNGSDSTNESTSTTENNTDITLDNTAVVTNTVDLAAVTGENEASGNTGSNSSITTGDANLGVVVSTNVNSTVISGSGNCCPSPTSATNFGNGSGSTNTATATSTNDTNIDIGNDALIDTELVALSLSGSNEASYNTGGDSDIITGDANVSVIVITDANAVSLGIYGFDVNGSQNGDIILTANPSNCLNCDENGQILAENSGNGANSTNNANASSTNTTTETINNDGDIVNNIKLTADSGNNETNYNTNGDSRVTTGDANVAANVINTLNTIIDGVVYAVNIFGDLVGNILLPEQELASGGCNNCCGGDLTAANTENGANSTNNANAISTNNSTTTQTNNATIDNNIDLDANTGGNDVNFNTGGDSVVETGDVHVDANVINIANINVSGSPCDSPVYMVFVNDPNNMWAGSIVGAAPGTYFYTSDGLLFVVGANGELLAVNTGNGAGSTNSATATSTNTTNTTQNNTGSITNNIDIEANTGDNSASYNTGGASKIKTGNANIFVNVVNFINSNFSGRKVVMTVVNVFGSWIGHFVPPGFSAPAVGGTDSDSASSGSDDGNGESSESSDESSNSSPDSSETTVDNGSAVSSSFSGLVGGSRTEKTVSDDGSLTSAPAGLADVIEGEGGLPPLVVKITLASVIGLLAVLIIRRIILTQSQ